MTPTQRRSGSPGRLTVIVTTPDGGRVSARGLSAWLAGAAPARARGEVTVALVSDRRMRTLNRAFRGKDYATDVLSFPTGNGGRTSDVGSRKSAVRRRLSGAESRPSDALVRPSSRIIPASEGGRLPTSGRRPPTADVRPPTADGRSPLGDIVIATGVAARQAKEAGHSIGTELRVLALHGLLHLLGYNHARDQGQMARVERRLRRAAGLTDGVIERNR